MSLHAQLELRVAQLDGYNQEQMEEECSRISMKYMPLVARGKAIAETSPLRAYTFEAAESKEGAV